MYVPVFNALDDRAELGDLVADVGSAELITVGADRYPISTLLPVIWDDEQLIFHMAKANQHWRSIEPDSPALAVVTGPQAYVSAGWYLSKQDHGRVVPTWNYSAVQFTGRVSVHTDADWLRTAVTRLTDQNEATRHDRWHVSDAPESYVSKQLRAIVGIEFRIEQVEGKAKLSQNRDTADHAGVVNGLRTEGGAREAAIADSMERTGIRKRR